MKNINNTKNIEVATGRACKIRYYVLIGGFVAILLGLIARLAYLHVFEQAFLQSQGDARSTRTIESQAPRGMIQDRNGEPLAVSTVVKAVWVDPRKFAATQEQFNALIKVLNLSPREVLSKLNSHRTKGFLYLKRNVIPAVVDQVLVLNIPGLFVKPEYRRYYPSGEVNAHVLGITNIDDHGQEGLELAYNNWLSGKVQKQRVVKDLLGRTIDLLEVKGQDQTNRTLTLSIDQRLQYLAYRELKKAMAQHKAASGSVVVIHVPTGEVLAMVNQPSFNPNIRTNGIDREQYRNKAVTDYFEPGSVMKAFSLASVLEHTDVNANTMVNTAPGYMVLKGGVVRDIENYGLINVATMLQRSSNVGITKLVLDLPDDALWDTYDRFGFGFVTGSNFPGENSGVLATPGPDRPFVKATMAFGYGLGVTSLQLARAYAILGAGGIRKPVSFLKVDEDVAGVRVVSSRVAREVVDLLSNGIENGPSNAKVPGYHIAGKTGTARKLGKDGTYQSSKHLAVFGGLAPAINSKFAIVVTINEPSAGMYYSNLVAAPVFSRIAAGALRMFDVPPDLLETQGVHVAQHGSNHL